MDIGMEIVFLGDDFFENFFCLFRGILAAIISGHYMVVANYYYCFDNFIIIIGIINCSEEGISDGRARIQKGHY